MPLHVGRSVAQLRDALGVDRQRGRTRRSARERYPAVDLAALQFRTQQLSDRAFQPAQLVREAQLEVEVAVVDRPQLDHQRVALHVGSDRGEAGHAENHGSRFQSCETSAGDGKTGGKVGKVNEIFTLCAGLQRM